MSFIKSHGGDTFGTSKRTLFNVFTFDQKLRGDWDKRLVRKKEGPKIIERRVANIKTSGNEHIGSLVSLFYRNGFGGAVLMQSTLETDKFDVWDRQLLKHPKYNSNESWSFYVPHMLCDDKNCNHSFQIRLETMLQGKIDLVTAE